VTVLLQDVWASRASINARMLSLPALHALLTQVLSPTLHTAILLTTAGDLVSYSTSIVARSKDDIRVIVGLTGEIWLETTESQRTGRVDSEVRWLEGLLSLLIS